MNATRLFSCLYGPTLNVGRVMTPTLAMVVMRDAEIAAFKPKPFYSVQLSMNGCTAASRRFEVKDEAEQLMTRCKDSMRATIKTMDRKEKKERPPLLYDLTSLQRDANRILGFTAQQTLDYMQSLYEKKLVTYPRTDSRYLTNDMQQMLPKLIQDVAAKFEVANLLEQTNAETDYRSELLCDSSKVTDHHSIFPTRTMSVADLSDLPSGEKAILQLIAVRLLCAGSVDHRYAEDSIVMICGDEEFSRKNKTILWNGWKEIWQHFYPVKEKEGAVYDGSILTQNSMVELSEVELKEGKITPPKRFTDVICCICRTWIYIRSIPVIQK